MSLFKRGSVWWVRFTAPDGQQIRRSAGTANKRQAQEFHDSLKTELWRITKLGEQPRYSWQQAAERWVLEKDGEKATLHDDKAQLRWVHPYLGELYLDEVNRDLIDQITLARLKTGVKHSTVNRMLAVIRAILKRAEKDWEWLIKAPHIRLLPEAKKRVRWLTQEEAERLLAALPDYLADMMRFTLATGLRESNVTGLQWSQLDLKRECAWIHPDQAKARKAIPVPLNADALLVINAQVGKHNEFVFSYKGNKVRNASNHTWRKTLKRLGIVDFRWHDLRHTWASWHIQQGTPLHVLQELGGWAGPEMVQRYAHLSADHLKVYADQLAWEKSAGSN